MLVFVDESGCAGFKFGQGSSSLFCVAGVYFRSRSDAQVCDDSFEALRRQLGLSKHKEFHFSKERHEIREAFFRHVILFQFTYDAFTLNKRKLTSEGFHHIDSFYKWPIRTLFVNMKPRLRNAIVVYDRNGSRDFVTSLTTYLRRAMRNPDGSQTTIKKLRAESSKSNNLIQLADMVCGAVIRSYQPDKKGCAGYREMIRSHEETVRFWPR